MTSITTRSSSPGDAADGAGGRVTRGRARASMGRRSTTRSLLVITARSCRSAGAPGRLLSVGRSVGQTMSVKGAPHSRARPPSFLRPVNLIWATPRYSSSPLGGIEAPITGWTERFGLGVQRAQVAFRLARPFRNARDSSSITFRIAAARSGGSSPFAECRAAEAKAAIRCRMSRSSSRSSPTV